MQLPYNGQVTKKEYSNAIKIHSNQQFKDMPSNFLLPKEQSPSIMITAQ